LGGSVNKIAKIRQMDDVPLQDAVFEPILRVERLRRTVTPLDIERAHIRGFRDSIEIYRLMGPR